MGQGPEPPKHRIMLGPGSDLLNQNCQARPENLHSIGASQETEAAGPVLGCSGNGWVSLRVYLWEVKAIQCAGAFMHTHSLQQHSGRPPTQL